MSTNSCKESSIEAERWKEGFGDGGVSCGSDEASNGHEALRALMKHRNQFSNGTTLEIDLRKYFNSIYANTPIKPFASSLNKRN